MSKKIIFIGPKNVGKTTLKKVYFEGESAKELLETTLRATIGGENIIFKSKEEIGIYDFAGQENEYWFGRDKEKVFKESKTIIVVFEINSNINDLKNFIQKVLDIKKELNLNSNIYVLIHKIDKVKDERKLQELKAKIKSELNIFIKKYKSKDVINNDSIKIRFTSIKGEYFFDTFSYFIEIINDCFGDNSLEINRKIAHLTKIIKILQEIDKNVIVSLDDLMNKFNISSESFKTSINILVKNKYIEVRDTDGLKTFRLTETGKSFSKSLFENHALNIESKKKTYSSQIKHKFKTEIPPFIGYFISDENGRSLVTTEIKNGALGYYLKEFNNLENIMTKKKKSEIDRFDVELIPMFISAIIKFAMELNIKNLNGFSLEGENLKLQIFEFDLNKLGIHIEDFSEIENRKITFSKYIVILFLNPSINMKYIKNDINEYFESFLKDNKNNLLEISKGGYIKIVKRLDKIGKKWLHNINRIYDHMIKDVKLFEPEHIKSFYKELDNLIEVTKKEYTLKLEKLKELKRDLMSAITKEKIEDIKLVVKKYRLIKANF